MKKLLVLGSLLVLSGSTMADSSCDRFESAYDRTFCHSRLNVESDKELNETYKALKAQIKPEVAKGLTQTQREWIAYREQKCSDGNGAVYVSCAYDVNHARAEYLRDRLRECKTSNCQNEAIIRQSW